MACQKSESQTEKIGVILPLEHRAMDEITEGFVTTLKKLYPKAVNIKIENAQNDPNLQRSIIQQMRDTGYNIIIPVGTNASQMTIAMVHNQPVVSLAADLSDQDRKKLQNGDVAIVHDEISVTSILQFFHQMYPAIHQVVLVHSPSDKVFPELKEAIAAGKQNGILIKTIMASSLPELTSVAQSLPANTQAIFVLKDSLIVSGIGTLANIANERHIPLMTSDQGSVQDGAGFSLGVHEREIGVEGAKLVAAILNGKKASSLPITDMHKLTVFVNQRALTLSFQNPIALIDKAKKLGFSVELTDQPTGR